MRWVWIGCPKMEKEQVSVLFADAFWINGSSGLDEVLSISELWEDSPGGRG